MVVRSENVCGWRLLLQVWVTRMQTVMMTVLLFNFRMFCVVTRNFTAGVNLVTSVLLLKTNVFSRRGRCGLR